MNIDDCKKLTGNIYFILFHVYFVSAGPNYYTLLTALFWVFRDSPPELLPER